ncbi:MAG TPA: DarT ssDNA thymidine ADP-ribosyltransferase family protein [Aggregatilineaceae bacterium]|nr:DarT ssDNA thymidine ADP-ribosyltransferase family protein [Aggregatilineaceae bacterium]
MLKSDSDEIIETLRILKDKYKGNDRNWWPDYVFHFADIRNIVRILEAGTIYSRNEMRRLGLDFLDAASPSIISHSGDHVKEYVRLYFRPKTPTQYRMEGIRPDSLRWRDSQNQPVHCPVPVFLVFDSRSILTRNDCEFTDGNFASHDASKGNTASFFKNLPFHLIYHTGPYDPSNSSIAFHRCAEVLIPRKLDLQHLKMIVCRSVAEKETLLSMIGKALENTYQSKIRIAPYTLYEKKWSYVESVQLGDSEITVNFSPDSMTPGPYRVLFEIINPDNVGVLGHLERTDFYIKPAFTLKLANPLSAYKFRVFLDGNIAYDNNHEPLPF